MGTLDVIKILRAAYKKYAQERSGADPESPGKLTVAEIFELLGFVASELLEELGEDWEFAWALEGIEHLCYIVAANMGEELEDEEEG